MRRFLLTVATAATALTGVACGDATGLGSSIAGSYELIRVNGQSLPASDNFGETTFYGGVLELDRNGDFSDLIQFRNPGDPAVRSVQLFGTWERIGDDEILLEYDEGFDLRAERLSSGRLMLRDDDGNRFEYRRF